MTSSSTDSATTILCPSSIVSTVSGVGSARSMRSGFTHAGAGARTGVADAAELVAEDSAAHGALGASLARVLRLPLSDRDGEG